MITAYCLNSLIRRALTHVIHIVQCVMKCFFFVSMKSINDWNGAIFKVAKPAWEKSLSFLAVVSSFYIIFASARWPNAYFINVWSTFGDWNGLKPETRFVLRDRIIAGLLTSSWLEYAPASILPREASLWKIWTANNMIYCKQGNRTHNCARSSAQGPFHVSMT